MVDYTAAIQAAKRAEALASSHYQAVQKDTNDQNEIKKARKSMADAANNTSSVLAAARAAKQKPAPQQ